LAEELEREEERAEEQLRQWLERNAELRDHVPHAPEEPELEPSPMMP
jgi:hypothetical protein